MTAGLGVAVQPASSLSDRDWNSGAPPLGLSQIVDSEFFGE
jgi:hypothetical protein